MNKEQLAFVALKTAQLSGCTCDAECAIVDEGDNMFTAHLYHDDECELLGRIS